MDVLTIPRATAHLGAVSEHLVIAKLLALGHRVAIPVVDDDGVDLVVDYRRTVQVKSSMAANVHNGHRFHVFTDPKNRWKADYFVFHGRGELPDTFWVVPGGVLREENVGQSVSLHPDKGGRSSRFARYIDAWHLLEDPDV